MIVIDSPSAPAVPLAMASGLPPSSVLRLGLGLGLEELGLVMGVGGELGSATTRVRFAAAVCAGDSLSLTVTATGKLPLAVGVPLTVSVSPLAFAASPSGSPVTAQS